MLLLLFLLVLGNFFFFFWVHFKFHFVLYNNSIEVEEYVRVWFSDTFSWVILASGNATRVCVKYECLRIHVSLGFTVFVRLPSWVNNYNKKLHFD